MKFNALILCLILQYNHLICQQHDNIWLFADLDIRSAKINFDSGAPYVEDLGESVSDLVLSSAIMSNKDGELIFYTDGCNIYASDHSIILNGNMINPGETWNNYCSPGSSYPTAPQSSLILPWPGNDLKYILFHKKVTFVQLSSGAIEAQTAPFYYSIISFENNPFGEVIQKNTILYNDIPRVESGLVTANRHANGIDWWVTTRLESGGGFLKYLLTPNGIEGPFIQDLGWYPENYENGGGECEFSSDGTRYVFNSSRSGMEIYDFDRETGEFDFVDTIDRREETSDIFFTGIGLSPNGRFAYVSENSKVYQYDLDAEDIEDSQVLIHIFTNPDSMFISPHSYYFQLGPDCKLYNYMNSGRYIHRINNPDLPGLACDYEVNAVELPFPAFRDQPQFPHFRLGPVGDEGSPCVESPNSTETVQAPKAELKVYPNPSSGPIRLFLPIGESPARWRLYDLQGRPLQELSLLPGQDQRVDVTATLPAGTYLWQLFREGKVVETGRLVRN